MSSYCGGRFTVPPGFDFKILPQKSKSVVVVSIIGFLDSFNNKYTTQLVDNFLQRSPFSLPCVNSVIKGYYDCERQLIFLHYCDSEKILADLLDKTEDYEKILEKWDTERLKNLFFLFTVSHFIVITTYGTCLDPKYITLFKLLNRLRHHLSPTLEQLLRSLPLPRYCIYVGRVMAPRLLFVFKLPPTIVARKLAKNENALLSLEKNLTHQIFNVFYESGLLEGNSSENRLFDITGYNYVRVLLPDVIETLEDFPGPHGQIKRGDLAQQLLETLISATGVTSLLEGSDLIKDREVCSPTALFPPPDGPEDRSFQAFLQCHLTSLLDDPNFGEHLDSHAPYTFELPTCKGWFTTCYKLYTILFDGSEPSPSPSTLEGSTDLCLGRQWQKLFPSSDDANAKAVTLFYTQSQLDRRLSSIRCEFALTAAEAHYRQDLPAHYSRTFHLAKVVSSYNFFLSLARGPCVIPTLERLTRRLARLYLAGRVGCPSVLVSGSSCRQELHTLPERFPGIASALRSFERRIQADTADGSSDVAGNNGAGGSVTELFIKHLKSVMETGVVTSRKMGLMKSRHSSDSILADCLQDVPLNLVGRWRYAWIEAAVNVMEREKNKLYSTESSASGDAPSLQHLSVMPHRSDQRYVSYCNCGRLQAIRPDPFDYQEANWEFFNALQLACCSKVNSIPLAPLILSSSMHNFCTHLEDKNAVEVELSDAAMKRSFSDLHQRNRRQVAESNVEDDGDDEAPVQFTVERNSLQGGAKEEERFLDARDKFDSDSDGSIMSSSDVSTPASPNYASTACTSQNSVCNVISKVRQLKLDTSDMSEEYGKDVEVGEGVEDPGSGDGCGAIVPNDGPLDINPVTKAKQRTPVTFFSGMPVLGQPAGLMPLHPSWAIHALGKYFSYSHSSGMALPGFLRGSHFLLPWDVQLSRPASITGTPSKNRAGRPRDFDSVKLFLGFEMECSMGHRFFLAGPDRPMTGTMQGGEVRRSVSSLLSHDLALYLPCRCSPTAGGAKADNGVAVGIEATVATEDLNGKEGGGGGGCSKADDDKTVWAQLMRVFVAIPSFPIRVRFAPMVRPGPMDSNMPIFHLGPTLDQESDSGKDTFKSYASQGFDRFFRASDDEKARTQPRSDSGDPGYVYLENGNIWVARFPFAYQDGDTIYRRPQDPKQISECCLIRGSLLVEEL